MSLLKFISLYLLDFTYFNLLQFYSTLIYLKLFYKEKDLNFECIAVK